MPAATGRSPPAAHAFRPPLPSCGDAVLVARRASRAFRKTKAT
jgi:hypothetical protein